MINNYTYDEIKIGLAHCFNVTITEKLQDMFFDLSGDINPLHTDTKFAINKGFEDKVVYGMLIASFFSTLAGVFIPGKNCLIHSVETKFLKPTYIGDTIDIKGTVVEKNDTFKLITIKVVITKADGTKVSKGEIKAGVLDE